ncbi:MAG: helix-turn-helix transcriptional regulator [Rhodospirillales bacterium]|nr:helix-turn-helix transcriptional regulator [Rhodospirillales bacterium]
MTDAIRVARVFRHLLDAAADFSKWPIFLENLTGLFNAKGANLLYFDHGENKLAFSMQHGYDHVSLPMLEQLSSLFPDDPRVAYAMRHAGMPVTCRQCVDEDVLHASRVYKEFLGPAGIEYTMGVHFMDENMGYALSVMRGPDGEPFTPADSELFGELVPSVKQAIQLHKQLAMLDFEKRAALDAFDILPMGLVLTGEDGEVRFANRMAREISRDGDGFGIDNNRILTHISEESVKILDCIGRAVRSARTDKILPAEGLSITRPSGGQSYEVVIATVWGNHLRFGLGQLGEPVAVLFITDPDRPQEAPPELLQRLYGLTPAEAKVVEQLVAGSSVNEISETLDLSIYTVREYLSIAFEKTGTKRQGELIKRILSTPVWMSAREQREKFPESAASRLL